MEKNKKDLEKEIEGFLKVCNNFCEFEEKVRKERNEITKRINSINNELRLRTRVKPILKDNHTSKDVEEYLKLLKEYESNDYDSSIKEIYNLRELIQFLDDTLMREAENFSDFYTIVPVKYQNKVKSLAWERGHSSGYSEYYNQLCSLVEIFEE